MPGFKDKNGDHWELRITPRVMREVKEFSGVNLGTILHEDMKPLIELLADPIELSIVVYAICREQAERRNVSCETFLDNFVGQPIEEAGQALMEGLLECFPTSQCLPLAAAAHLVKKYGPEAEKKANAYVKHLTSMESVSVWQRWRTWIRGILPAMSWH